MVSELTQTRRSALAALAVTLIPESSEGPSAAEAEVAERWADVTLTERPDLIAGLVSTLDTYSGSKPRAFLERLESTDSPAFAELTYVVAASFFKSPVAKEWLGFDRIRDEYEAAEPELTEETERLLEPVRRMKPFYRPTEYTHD